MQYRNRNRAGFCLFALCSFPFFFPPQSYLSRSNHFNYPVHSKLLPWKIHTNPTFYFKTSPWWIFQTNKPNALRTSYPFSQNFPPPTKNCTPQKTPSVSLPCHEMPELVQGAQKCKVTEMNMEENMSVTVCEVPTSSPFWLRGTSPH